MNITTPTAIAFALALAACGPSETPESAPAPTPAETASVEPSVDDAAIAAAIAALPAPYNSADYANGRRVFAQCRACHLTEAGAGNSVGPNLHGVFGRQAGSLAGYAFSPAVKTSGITWDAANLDKWLTGPATFIPNTRMTFNGVRNDNDRRDVIAYLEIETRK